MWSKFVTCICACELLTAGAASTRPGLPGRLAGGLSGEDLAELTQEPVGKIERILHRVTGRAFTSRGRQWGTSSQSVFVLAHEELLQAALRSLRSTELKQRRETIHAWAESYRGRKWPAATPEYLLRGYLRMLRSTGDLPRMITLATDMARIDRMLDISGGDAAALADITTIQEYIRDQPCPDLAATLRLAYIHRDLIRRNSNIPVRLPAGALARRRRARRAPARKGVAGPPSRSRRVAPAAGSRMMVHRQRSRLPQ